MAYHLRQAHGGTPSVVTVDHPTAREQNQYTFSLGADAKTAYGVVAFLPNPTNTGKTLVIEGTDSQATEAAGDFITSEEELERLQALFHSERFPYFQVVLRISRSNGTPLESEVISYRVFGS